LSYRPNLYKIKIFNEFKAVRKNYRQRAGIADGGEIEVRPPELLPGFLIKLNIKN
jgi:hypothetical protein